MVRTPTAITPAAAKAMRRKSLVHQSGMIKSDP
jgi:hypothetical protein